MNIRCDYFKLLLSGSQITMLRLKNSMKNGYKWRLTRWFWIDGCIQLEWNKKWRKYSRPNKKTHEQSNRRQRPHVTVRIIPMRTWTILRCAQPDRLVFYRHTNKTLCIISHRILTEFSVTSLSQNKLIKRWIQFYILILILILILIFIRHSPLRWLSTVLMSILLNPSLNNISHLPLSTLEQWSSFPFFKWSISIWTSHTDTHTQTAHVSRWVANMHAVFYMKLFVHILVCRSIGKYAAKCWSCSIY